MHSGIQTPCGVLSHTPEVQSLEARESSQGARISPDGRQELTSYTDPAANMTAATYDGDGLRQTATTTPTGGPPTTESFTWDPSGTLPRLLMDSDNAYIYGPGSTPFEQVNLASGTVQYLVSDQLGSVRGVVHNTGTLDASTSYDAWGNPQTTGGLTNNTPFGYAGYYTDPTDLTYNLARYYDPTTGQFFVVDPKFETTLQAYEYANDDPVIATDPAGLDPLEGTEDPAWFGLAAAPADDNPQVEEFDAQHTAAADPQDYGPPPETPEETVAASAELADLYADGKVPTKAQLENYANQQGWTLVQSKTGPAKYVDENGITRLTIKSGSARTPGSEGPHIEVRNAMGQRTDPFGNRVVQHSDDNHFPYRP